MEPILTTIFTKPALQLANKLLQPLVKRLESEVSSKSQLLVHRIFNSYSKYLEHTVERHSYFNSIVFKNEQRRLIEFYLPLTLINKDKPSILLDNYPKTEIDEYKRLLIVDTAGMGKTTLLKFLFLNCVEQRAGIPMFVELRKLSKKVTLSEFLLDQLSNVRGKCNPDLFYRLLESGDFVFFLDGYDEIGDLEREIVTASIQQFIEKTPGNKFIMTSREEAGLAAFPSFLRYTVSPLTREEAYALLKKYADGQLADNLIAKLELPENIVIHEFLTNPLLTSLLFKSFEYKHTIPLKRHIFYRQVYEALFETHDLTKEGGEFDRPKRCRLDVDRFEQVLRAFGALSYKAGKIEQSKSEALVLLSDARTLASEVKTPPSKVLHDLTHAVPLLVEDGNYIRWSHRSIQEYFAAEYICKNTGGRQADILRDLYNSDDINKHTNLLLLCADIDRSAFDQSIGKAIAIKLLADYEASYQGFPSSISDFAIHTRRCLTVGRQVFLLNVEINKDEQLTKDGSKKFDEQMSSFHQRMRLESGATSTSATRTYGSTILIGYSLNPLVKFIDDNVDRLRLPFLEPGTHGEGISDSWLDGNFNFYKVDDDTLSDLNQPAVFEHVNEVLADSNYCEWRFNPKAAKEYLKDLSTARTAKSKLEPW